MCLVPETSRTAMQEPDAYFWRLCSYFTEQNRQPNHCDRDALRGKAVARPEAAVPQRRQELYMLSES